MDLVFYVFQPVGLRRARTGLIGEERVRDLRGNRRVAVAGGVRVAQAGAEVPVKEVAAADVHERAALVGLGDVERRRFIVNRWRQVLREIAGASLGAEVEPRRDLAFGTR